MANHLTQIQELIADIFIDIDSAHDAANATAAIPFWKAARKHLVKLRLLIATSPTEVQNEMSRMKFNDSSNVMELIDQVEQMILEGESGIDGQAIQRLEIALPDEDGFTWTSSTTETTTSESEET